MRSFSSAQSVNPHSQATTSWASLMRNAPMAPVDPHASGRR